MLAKTAKVAFAAVRFDVMEYFKPRKRYKKISIIGHLNTKNQVMVLY